MPTRKFHHWKYANQIESDHDILYLILALHSRFKQSIKYIFRHINSVVNCVHVHSPSTFHLACKCVCLCPCTCVYETLVILSKRQTSRQEREFYWVSCLHSSSLVLCCIIITMSYQVYMRRYTSIFRISMYV